MKLGENRYRMANSGLLAFDTLKQAKAVATALKSGTFGLDVQVFVRIHASVYGYGKRQFLDVDVNDLQDTRHAIEADISAALETIREEGE